MPGFKIENGEIQKIGIWAGDIINFGGVRYKVTKVNPKNYKLMRETDGHEFGLRKDAYGIKKSEDQTWKGPKEQTPYELYQQSNAAGIVLGTPVRLKGRLASKYGHDTYVCIAKPNDGTLRLAKLGGDGDRYLRKIKAAEVEVVDL